MKDHLHLKTNSVVCYHTPKPISLDIFELLTTTTQTNTKSNTHKDNIT